MLWLRTNGLFGTDGFLHSVSPKAGLRKVVCLLHDTVVHLLILTTLFKKKKFFFSYRWAKNSQILLPLGLSWPSLLQGNLWVRMLCVFESSLLSTIELFGGKDTKHLKLKLSKPMKCNF